MIAKRSHGAVRSTTISVIRAKVRQELVCSKGLQVLNVIALGWIAYHTARGLLYRVNGVEHVTFCDN